MEQLALIFEKLKKIEEQLSQQKSVFTLEEVATYTQLSKSYLYKLTSRGDIPHSKPNGKQVYFDKAEIDSWLLRNKTKTNSSIDIETSLALALRKRNRL